MGPPLPDADAPAASGDTAAVYINFSTPAIPTPCTEGMCRQLADVLGAGGQTCFMELNLAPQLHNPRLVKIRRNREA